MTSRRSFLRSCLGSAVGSIAAVAMAVYVPRFVLVEEAERLIPCGIEDNRFWRSGELPVNEMCVEDLQRIFDSLLIVRPPEPRFVTHEEYVRLGGNQ